MLFQAKVSKIKSFFSIQEPSTLKYTQSTKRQLLTTAKQIKILSNLNSLLFKSKHFILFFHHVSVFLLFPDKMKLREPGFCESTNLALICGAVSLVGQGFPGDPAEEGMTLDVADTSTA